MRNPYKIGLMALLSVSIAASALMSNERAHAEIVSLPASFDREIAGSMARMHADMSIPATGDPDRDFAAMMIPHHQGAIDMAKAELAHGRDPVLRRLAQGILVEQAQEIEVMRRALAALPPARSLSIKAPGEHDHHAPAPKDARP